MRNPTILGKFDLIWRYVLDYGPDAAAGMKQRVRANLLYLAKVRGSVVKEGEREAARWRLAFAKDDRSSI